LNGGSECLGLGEFAKMGGGLDHHPHREREGRKKAGNRKTLKSHKRSARAGSCVGETQPHPAEQRSGVGTRVKAAGGEMKTYRFKRDGRKTQNQGALLTRGRKRNRTGQHIGTEKDNRVRGSQRTFRKISQERGTWEKKPSLNCLRENLPEKHNKDPQKGVRIRRKYFLVAERQNPRKAPGKY